MCTHHRFHVSLNTNSILLSVKSAVHCHKISKSEEREKLRNTSKKKVFAFKDKYAF